MSKEIKEITTNKAHKLYGNLLPKEVQERLNVELNFIIDNEFDIVYMIAQKLVEKANKDGYFIGIRGYIGSPFVTYLLGITQVNPLSKEYGGFEIPFEIPTKEMENKRVDIKLTVATEYYKEICEYMNDILKKENIMINNGEDKNKINIFKRMIQTKDGKILGNIEIQTRSTLTILKKLYETTGVKPTSIVVKNDITDIGDFLIKHELCIGVDLINLVDALQTIEINSFDNLITLLGLLYNREDCIFPKSHLAEHAMLIYKIAWYGVHYPKEYAKVMEKMA